MPLVQAKCTNCGANLEINNTLDAAVCPYCGAAFIVEKAINNYNNTTNHINAGSVNAYGGSSADFVVHGGVLEKYNGAAIEVVIPNSVKIIGRAFDSMAITSVVIPDSVQEIGSGAFYGCAALTSVTMGNSVQKIGQSAFEYCRALTAITIPDSVKEIGYYAFDGCSALTSLTIGNSVTEISSDAFRGCSSLIAIIIPASVQWIGSGAFLSCRSLWTVEIKGNPLIALHAFWALPIRKQRIRKTKGDRKPKGKRKQKGNRKSKDKRKPKDGKRNRKAAATSLPPCMAPTTAQRCGRCAASGTTRWIGHGTDGRLSAPTMPSVPRSSAGSARTAGFRHCSVPCWIVWSTGCGKTAWRTRRIRTSIKEL